MSTRPLEALTRCPTCGKWRYPSRAAARKAAKRLRGHGRMNAYPCGAFWHIGHLPASIRHGLAARADVYPTKEPAS